MAKITYLIVRYKRQYLYIFIFIMYYDMYNNHHFIKNNQIFPNSMLLSINFYDILLLFAQLFINFFFKQILPQIIYNIYFMKNHRNVLLFFVILSLCILSSFTQSNDTQSTSRILTLDYSLIMINNTRSKNVQRFCPQNTTGLVSSTDYSTNSQYFSMLSTYFKQNITTIVRGAYNQDMSSVSSQAQNYISTYIFIIPFFIGLILIVVLWTCLCCCCICPKTCPSRCCQKEQEELYTKGELIWPAVFLILVLLTATIASIPGITKVAILPSTIKTTSCGLSIFIDDILNGGIASDNLTYFAGLSVLSSKLQIVRNNFQSIINNLTGNVRDNVITMVTDTNNANNHIQTIVDSSTPNATLTLNYNKPTPQSSATVTSTYGNLLGTPNNSSSLTGVLFNIVIKLYNAMSFAQTSLNQIYNQNWNLTYNLDDALNNIHSAYDNVISIESNMGDILNSLYSFLDFTQLGVLVYFAAVIGFGFIAILGTILVSCCDKVKCRHIMYFSCCFLYILCIVGFLITAFLSVIIPVMYNGCNIFNDALKDRASYLDLINNLNIKVAHADQIGICLKGGSGQFLSSSLGVKINDKLFAMQDSINTARNYSTYDSTPLTDNLAYLKNNNTLQINGGYNDIIADSGTLNYFLGVANQTYYSCANINSIVPSTNSPSISIIPCATGTTPVNCTSFTTCNQASACINLDSIFSNYLSGGSTSTDIKNDISTLYPSCSNIADDLNDLYQNWYIPKTTKLAAIQTNTNAVSDDVDTILSHLTSLTSNFSSAYTNINGQLNNIIDPQYGIMKGLNCFKLRQDVLLVKDTICVTTFNSFFYIFMIIGIISFALIFSVCCIVCTGVRHYKQSQKMINTIRIKIPEQSSGRLD